MLQGWASYSGRDLLYGLIIRTYYTEVQCPPLLPSPLPSFPPLIRTCDRPDTKPKHSRVHRSLRQTSAISVKTRDPSSSRRSFAMTWQCSSKQQRAQKFDRVQRSAYVRPSFKPIHFKGNRASRFNLECDDFGSSAAIAAGGDSKVWPRYIHKRTLP